MALYFDRVDDDTQVSLHDLALAVLADDDDQIMHLAPTPYRLERIARSVGAPGLAGAVASETAFHAAVLALTGNL